MVAGVLALSIGVFWGTIFRLDPLGDQKIIAFFAFFLSLFGAISSFLALVFFFASEILARRRLGEKAFLVALRRGVLVAVFVNVLLGLHFLRMLGVFELILLAIFLSLFEYIFCSD